MKPGSIKIVKFLAIIILSYFTNNHIHAEYFDIQKFKIHIEIDSRGVLHVEEQISLHFSEPRRGLIRKIPFKYTVKQVEGEVAKGRGAVGSKYVTQFENIGVETFEYTVYEEGDYQTIKIGSADKYVDGDQTYIIRYDVYGAINYFNGHSEFNWNLTGNEWSTSNELTEFEIEFPGNHNLSMSDVKVFTGPRFATNSDATWNLLPGKITGKTTQRLGSNEGITVAIRFPNTLLPYTPVPIEIIADNYLYRDWVSHCRVTEDGILEVEEKFVVEFLEPYSQFKRHLPLRPFSGGANNYIYDIQLDKGDESEWIIDSPKDGPQLRAYYRQYMPGDKDTFSLKYKVYGAVQQDSQSTRVDWQVFGKEMWEPVGRTRISVETPEGHPLHPNISWALPGRAGTSLEARYPNNHTALTELGPLSPNETYSRLSFHLDPPIPSIAAPPSRLLADQYYFSDYDLNVTVKKTGTIEFRHNMEVTPVFESDYLYLSPEIEKKIWTDPSFYWGEHWKHQHKIPQYRLFGKRSKIIGEVLEFNEDDYAYPSEGYLYFDLSLYDGPDPQEVSYAYSLTGLLGEETDPNIIALSPTFEEPVALFKAQVEFPDADKIDPAQYKAWVATDLGNEPLSLSTQGNTLILKGERLPANSQPYLQLVNPGQNIPLATRFQLIWMNNTFLFLPLFFLVGLFLIWLLWGRDRKLTSMVRFHPPEELTSAEAGLLVDGKAHNRDLISLLYYWSAHGRISIREIKKKGGRRDYELTKLKPLLPTARGYESILFERLFRGYSEKGKEKVKISSLRYSFANSLKLAKNALEDEGKHRGFFVSGTRGIGKAFRILGIILGIITVFTFGLMAIAQEGDPGNTYQVTLGLMSSSILLYIFGRIMPKRDKYGSAQMEELIGFREFIKTAEKDRLKMLVDEDPEYFGKTLSYAVSLGLAKDWAKKFEGLTLERPSWYYGHTPGSTFTPILFTREIERSIKQIQSDFTAVAAPSGGSSYSSGGSSFSSFGSSGGSSFSSSSSSSGGYSGGGFGGGGGSSW